MKPSEKYVIKFKVNQIIFRTLASWNKLLIISLKAGYDSMGNQIFVM